MILQLGKKILCTKVKFFFQPNCTGTKRGSYMGQMG